ncbi:unnamed protein product [Moneuplotes crassus]|uniref:Uncharacterized protein n=1 Tax=Euplotes crassus TaxID=5936 RepID=A0AAD1XW67_EUPCR|nr:unnamed protein product [Moneuplotes crassus]
MESERKLIEQRVQEKILKLEEQMVQVSYHNCTYGSYNKRKFCGCNSQFADLHEIIALFKKTSRIGLKKIEMFKNYQHCNQQYFKKYLMAFSIQEITRFGVLMKVNKNEKYRFYLAKVIKLLPNVTRQLSLRNCEIRDKQLRKIIQIGRHIPRIHFINSYIYLNDLKLSDCLNYEIRAIDFIILGKTPSSYWRTIDENIPKFLKAASSTSLKTSLKSMQASNLATQILIQTLSSELEFPNLKSGFPFLS